MATLTLTFAAGTDAGAKLHRLSHQLNKLASTVPDLNPTGAATVLTISDAVGGTCGIQITAGPYAGAQLLV